MTDQPTTGTFIVTHADDDSALLRNVTTAQVHTLEENPDLAVNDVLEATLEPDPPLGVTWTITEREETRSIELLDTDLSPTTQIKDVAADLEVGEIERIERAGRGEIHVLSVPPNETEGVATEILEDIETRTRGARLGAVRVEIRQDPALGIVSVRYLPD